MADLINGLLFQFLYTYKYIWKYWATIFFPSIQWNYSKQVHLPLTEKKQQLEFLPRINEAAMDSI